MGEISPISAKGIDPKRFKKFKVDLELLLNWESQEVLANQMGIKRSNFNRYVKGYLPITKGFLKKFYEAWEDRISEKSIHAAEDPFPQPDIKQEPTLTEIFTILQRIEGKIDRQAGHLNEKN